MKKILFILLAATVLVSCKKEDKIEKNLWKNGGEWNIAQYIESETYKYQKDHNSTEIVLDYGTFKFDKDGTCIITIEDEEDVYIQKMTYDNTESTLTLFDMDGEGMRFDLEWEKNNFTATAKSTYTYDTYDDNYNPIEEVVTSTVKFVCEKNK